MKGGSGGSSSQSLPAPHLPSFPQKPSEPAAVRGERREGCGAGEAVAAMAPHPVETAMLKVIDRRFDRRMLTAGLGEAGFRLPLPLRLRKIPLLRQRVQIKHRIQVPAVLRAVKAAVETAGPEFRKPLLRRPDDRNGMADIGTFLHDLMAVINQH